MRESVTIVLNEREASKARAAEALQKALADAGIAASRLNIGAAIEDVVLERRPLVLVLDYLLGDYSTGLDVLTKTLSAPPAERPTVFFFTDEPSVPVAVEAMRLGASDYFELDHPLSVQKLTRAIQEVIGSRKREKKDPDKHIRGSEEPQSLDDLVAESKLSRALHTQLELLASEGTPLTLIEGPPGCGKLALARIFAALRGPRTFQRTVDLRTCIESVEQITGHGPRICGPRLGSDLGLTLLHAEEDDGSLLDSLAANLDTWIQPGSESFVVACTESAATAERWRKLLPKSRTLQIPALSKRAEDIAPLVQRFILEGAELADERLKPFDAETLRWMSTLPWPGNIRQLRAITIESAIRANAERSATVKSIIEEQCSRWDDEHRASDFQRMEPPMVLAQALAMCGHNYRSAAAHLGISTRALLRTLTSTGGEK